MASSCKQYIVANNVQSVKSLSWEQAMLREAIKINLNLETLIADLNEFADKTDENFEIVQDKIDTTNAKLEENNTLLEEIRDFLYSKDGYLMTYDVNGGENTPRTAVVEAGKNYTVTSQLPTRFGYNFIAWRVGVNTYRPGETITDVNENINFVAQWERETLDVTGSATTTMIVDYPSEVTYLKVTPSETANYYLYSTGANDTSGYLYDATGELLASDDDSDDPNFSISYPLKANKSYYLGIRYYDPDATGEIEVTVTKGYAVTYAANGGEGTVPESQVKEYNVNLTLATNNLTKSSQSQDGFTVSFNPNGGSVDVTEKTASDTINFSANGWNTKEDGTGADYASGATYTSNETLDLFAVFNSSRSLGTIQTPAATRSNGQANATISYNGNGGNPDYDDDFSDATVTYTAQGWYTQANGGVKRANNGGTYTPSNNETLYQHWGETVGDFSSVFLPGATRSGYEFLGWAESASAATADYQENDEFFPDGDTTLYAVWRKLHTVTYNANGGDGTVPTTQYKAVGTSITLATNNLAQPELIDDGFTVVFNANGGLVNRQSMTNNAFVSYTPDGWNTDIDGLGDAYTDGQEYGEDEDLNLYAVWTQETEYDEIKTPTATQDNGLSTLTLTLNTLGGECEVDHLDTSVEATFTGEGWYTDIDGGIKRTSNGGTYTPLNNETLYQHWISTTTGDYPAITLPTVTRDGYRFLGWSFNASATTGDYQADEEITIDEDKTIFAVWDPIDPYRLSHKASTATVWTTEAYATEPELVSALQSLKSSSQKVDVQVEEIET